MNASAITAERISPAIRRIDGTGSREIVLIEARVILRTDECTIHFIIINSAVGEAGGVFAVIIWTERCPSGETARFKSRIGQNIRRVRSRYRQPIQRQRQKRQPLSPEKLLLKFRPRRDWGRCS